MTFTPLHRLWPCLGWDDVCEAWQNPVWRFMGSVIILLIIWGLAVSLVPPLWYVFLKVYLVWMFVSLSVGMLVQARTWITWGVATLIFSLALNVLGAWYVTTLSI